MAARDINTIQPGNDATDEPEDQAYDGNVYGEAGTTLDTIIADPFLMQRPISDTVFGEKASNNRQDAQHAANATMAAAVTISASQRFDNFEMTINGEEFDGQDAAELADLAAENPEYMLGSLVDKGYSYEEAEDFVELLREHADALKAGRMPEEVEETLRDNKDVLEDWLQSGKATYNQNYNSSSSNDFQPDRNEAAQQASNDVAPTFA